MQNNVKMFRNLFTWTTVLIVTAIIEFGFFTSISWTKPWHKNVVIIMISALCFRLAGTAFDKLAPMIGKNINQ